jgi:hypothetical protein
MPARQHEILISEEGAGYVFIETDKEKKLWILSPRDDGAIQYTFILQSEIKVDFGGLSKNLQKAIKEGKSLDEINIVADENQPGIEILCLPNEKGEVFAEITQISEGKKIPADLERILAGAPDNFIPANIEKQLGITKCFCYK